MLAINWANINEADKVSVTCMNVIPAHEYALTLKIYGLSVCGKMQSLLIFG